jgi:glycosyltransferase involved in cell wall biosynthesis
MRRPRLVRVTTVPMSLRYLLRGQLAYMHANGFDVTAVSADGREREDIIREGIEHVVIPFTRKITPVQDVVCLLKLVRLFKNIKPDIVHTHTPKAGLLGMVAAAICGVPVRLHTVAGMPLMEASGLKRWLLWQAERITYACAHRVYPNSSGLMDYLRLRLGKSRTIRKIKLIASGSSNGIDSAYFSRTDELMKEAQLLRKKYGVAEEAIVYGFVGRIVKDKGIGELINAFKAVGQSGRNAYLLLVGALEEELDPLLPHDRQFLESDTRVIMAGFQEDVRPYILMADVFVFPSYREGFPNVVMQAACLGVPCIVSDINGCNEIIKHEETGLVVPPKDREELYRAMIRMAVDRALRELFAKRAREFVSGLYDQEYVWRELLGEYGSWQSGIGLMG